MKKVLIICGLLLSIMTFAKAQDGDRKMPTPEERAEKGTAQLTKKLNLTEDQATKVKAILLDQATASVKMREENKGGDRAAMMAKMKAAMEENDVKINALLNDDQKKAYVAYKEERMKNRKGGGKGPAGGAGGQ